MTKEGHTCEDCNPTNETNDLDWFVSNAEEWTQEAMRLKEELHFAKLRAIVAEQKLDSIKELINDHR